MRLLLDTHVFIWTVYSDKLLPNRFAGLIADPANEVYVSAVAVWEISIKRKLGRLDFKGDVPAAIEQMQFREVAITGRHAEAAGNLPLLHRDPFDRLVVAQAVLEQLTLLTVDEQILAYHPPTL